MARDFKPEEPNVNGPLFVKDKAKIFSEDLEVL